MNIMHFEKKKFVDNNIKSILKKDSSNKNTLINQSSYIILFLIVLSIIFGIINPRFFTPKNFGFILKQSSVLLIVSLAETFVILTGSIDLSLQGIVVLSCVVTAKMLDIFNFSSPLVVIFIILISVGIGSICGLLNGLILTKGKIPSFLITLGTGTMFQGFCLLITGGYTIPITNSYYKWLGSGDILKIPTIAIIALIVYIYAVFLNNYTPFGRYVFAVGGGELTARYSGISVDKIKLIVFVFAGMLAGLGGALTSARLGAGTSTAGGSIELDVIAATVMSGTSLSGGVGNVSKTILGVCAITLLSNGLNIIGVSPHIQIVLKGFIVILVVFSSTDRSKILIAK